MCQHPSTPSRRALARGAVAASALAFLIAAQSGAVADSNSPPAPITKAGTTRQVGIWSVNGWKRGNVASHCSAERPVRGAAPGGGALQFALIRLSSGYRIALGADDWEFEPQSSFPVELSAPPVIQRNDKAIAVGTNVVIVELGSSSETMQRLSELPTIKIKTSQTVFKLPLAGFADALAATESCFNNLKSAASPTEGTAATVTRINTAPPDPAPAKVDAAKTDAKPYQDLVEERTFLTYTGDRGTFRLEALIVRPARAEGKLPIALITHGKNLKAEENQQLRADFFAPQARDFAARGWLSVVVIRRGYGESDGIPGVSRGAAFMSCRNADLVRGFDIEADDLAAALQVIAARPDADPSRVIAVGQSLGGGTVLAFAARRPAGLIGVVNVSGGVWRSDDNGACDFDALVEAMTTFGSRTRVPTLWLYAENDSLFRPDVVARLHSAYTEAGGVAKLWMFPPILNDGHNLFADFGGRVKWLNALDRFFKANRMPNTNVARVDDVMSTVKLADRTRPVVEEYFSTPAPKLLVVSASRTTAYWIANPNDIDGARRRALARCHEKSGAECSVVMENNNLVRPVVTGLLKTGTADN
ncbi:MAG: alpha/beta hydrolase family protein [Xanthobacteraceae bacterium]